MSNIQFNEVQGFRLRWVWAGVIALNLLFIYAIVQQVFLGKPFGPKPAADMVLVLMEGVPLILFFFLRSIRLKTCMDDSGIHYRFTPFQFKTIHIEWHELSDAYMREYNSFYEFGGWGIRRGSAKSGTAINTSASGKRGLQLRFGNGKLLLIGTKKPAEMEKIINQIMAEGRINRRI